jgi:hypothetical protein
MKPFTGWAVVTRIGSVNDSYYRFDVFVTPEDAESHRCADERVVRVRIEEVKRG